MPRTKLLVSALALALAGATTAQAQTFSNVIVFGDSLSDAGQFVGTVPGAQGSFTTNPDPVWVELVGSYYGFDVTPSNFGGYDYAFGGAQIRDPMPLGIPGPFCITSIPAGLPCQSMTTQLGWYLARTGGVVDPNALYSVWGGANDLFFNAFRAGQSPLHPFYITSAQAAANMQVSALTEVGIIKALQDKGARAILVFNLPDVGRTPDGIASGNAAGATGLAFTFNAVLNAGLGTLGDGIIPINAWGFFNELLADPAAYGISNTTGRACVPAVSVVYCSTSTLIEPNANNTYAFADGSHPSGASHRLVASIVTATLSAPGQVSMAAEIPLQVYDDQSRTVNRQIFGAGGRDVGTTSVYGAVNVGQQEFEANANTSAMDNDLFSLTFGADFRSSESFSFGAAATFGSSDGDVGGSTIENKEVLLSGYAVGHFGIGYISGSITGGSANLDIVRHIVLGPTVRDEVGNTSATHTGAELGAGLTFGDDSFRHGPFISATWQKIDVSGYAEDGLSSTAMYFSDFNRKSTVGRIGYQAQGDAGGFRPFGRVAWARDTQDRVTRVQAGSNTMNGHFTLDGFPGAEDWIEAELGMDYAVSDSMDVSLSYRARLSDDTQDLKSFNLGFRKEFGAAAAPAPEPVVEEVVQTTCADLDDDSDGVNNCNDKCPTSAAGEAVGADGCPVPAAEPEPVMESKPFRN